jgi:hypothetical protein
MEEDLRLTPPEVVETANSATLTLIPEKSRKLYMKTYTEFIQWCSERKICHYSETVLLAYFSNISEKGQIASLWSKYSMLKSTLSIKDDIDISKFSKLIMFIKRQKEGHIPKKSKVLEKEHIHKFINDAPNSNFLMIKVNIIKFKLCIINIF